MPLEDDSDEVPPRAASDRAGNKHGLDIGASSGGARERANQKTTVPGA